MRDIDKGLKSVDDENRRKFFRFFKTMLQGMNRASESDKKKVENAFFAFFNMRGSLSKSFWGEMDFISTLHFNCSGFGASHDPEMINWKKFWCNPLVRRSVAMVGTLPSMAEIGSVLNAGINFMVHHVDHFFPTVPASQSDMLQEFDDVGSDMLLTLVQRVKVVNTRTDEAMLDGLETVTFVEVLNGIMTNDVSIDYKGFFDAATNKLIAGEDYVPNEKEDDERIVAPQKAPPKFVSPMDKLIFELQSEVVFELLQTVLFLLFRSECPFKGRE